MIPFLLAYRRPLGWLAATLGALALLYAVYTHVLHRGELRERARWEERLKAEDTRNRKVEAGLRDDVAELATKLASAQAKRDVIVTRYRDRIVSADYPDCAISPEGLADRNAIRADDALPAEPQEGG